MKTIKAFIQGVIEFRCSFTTYYGDYAIDRAYDYGREFAHKITARRFEEAT